MPLVNYLVDTGIITATNTESGLSFYWIEPVKKKRKEFIWGKTGYWIKLIDTRCNFVMCCHDKNNHVLLCVYLIQSFQKERICHENFLCRGTPFLVCCWCYEIPFLSLCIVFFFSGWYICKCYFEAMNRTCILQIFFHYYECHSDFQYTNDETLFRAHSSYVLAHSAICVLVVEWPCCILLM